MNERSSNSITLAMAFKKQIYKVMKASAGGNWRWEDYIPGPISNKDAEIIMRIAGCWCEDPSEGNVRFYTNQNHETWRCI